MDLSGTKRQSQQRIRRLNINACIVHQVRNTMKYVSDKDRKPFCADLKTIYQAPTEEKALDALERVTENGVKNIPIP